MHEPSIFAESVSQQPRREISQKEKGKRQKSELEDSSYSFPSEFQKVCAAARAGHSALVLGEAGTGTNDFAQALYEEMLGDFQAAIAIYKGSLKSFFKTIAFQLDIPTENEDGKQLTVDQLKEDIGANCNRPLA